MAFEPAVQSNFHYSTVADPAGSRASETFLHPELVRSRVPPNTQFGAFSSIFRKRLEMRKTLRVSSTGSTPSDCGTPQHQQRHSYLAGHQAGGEALRIGAARFSYGSPSGTHDDALGQNRMSTMRRSAVSPL
jgi:hypothetical protein